MTKKRRERKVAPYSERETEEAWEKASSRPYKKAALNERAAVRESGRDRKWKERKNKRKRERRGSL